MLNQKLKSQSLLRTLFLFGILSISLGTFAQKNNIQFKLHTPFTIELTYERSINTKHSVLLDIQTSVYSRNDYILTNLSQLPSSGDYRVNFSHRQYLNSDQSMDGLYFGQSIGFGFYEANASKKTGEIVTTDFLWEEVTYPVYAKGNSEGNLGSLGLDFGYQKRWDQFNMDTGINLNYNVPFSQAEGIPLDNGDVADFPSHIKGIQASFYVGIGFAF